jgi:hypothetical protein
MKTKTKKTSQPVAAASRSAGANLYNLISESPVIAESDRDFWLANYESLPVAAQKNLAQTLQETTREFTREMDSHMSRIAEINTKCSTKLTQIEKANEKVITARGEEDEADTYNAGNFDPDEILEELHNAGEF